MKDVLKILDWSLTEEKQERTIKQILDDDNFDIEPLTRNYDTEYMRNSAIIFSRLSDERLEPYIDNLLEWMQDMNWPGSVGGIQ